MKTFKGFLLGVLTTVVALATVVLITGNGASVVSMAIGKAPLITADGALRTDTDPGSIIAAATGDGSSRDKAVPLGGEAKVEGWEFRVNEVSTRATFPGESTFMAPTLKTGETYLVLNVTATYTGSDIGDSLSGMELEYVTPEGVGLGFSAPYFFDTGLENELPMNTKLYKDGAVTGNVLVVVPEVSLGGVVAVAPFFNFNKQVVFLATA